MASAPPATTTSGAAGTAGAPAAEARRPDVVSALAGVLVAGLWIGAVGLAIWAATSAAIWLLVSLGVTR